MGKPNAPRILPRRAPAAKKPPAPRPKKGMDDGRVKRTDAELLDQLLNCLDLDRDERRAFGDMLARLEPNRPLTPAQRQWAERVHHRLELDAQEVANLASSGRVEVTQTTDQILGDVLHHVPEHMRKPLKPPGMR